MDIGTMLQQENLKLKARLQELENTLEAIHSGEVDAIIVKGEKGDKLCSLTSSEQFYKFFIEKMFDAALIVSKQGTILYANQSFYEMLSLSFEKIIGTSIFDFVEDEQKSFFLKLLEEEGRKRSELTLVTSKHQKINVVISVSKGTFENAENLRLIISDVSALKKAERLIQASEDIAKSLIGTPVIKSALKDLIIELNSYLGWEVIALWSWNKEKADLACLEVAYIPDIDAEEFAQKIKHMLARKGSIPDRVWTAYHPIAIEDIAEDFVFTKGKEAMEAGMHGVLSFPIYENRQITGVVELFRRLPFQGEIDNTLYSLVSSTGINFGLYLQRKAVEETNLQFIQLIQHSSNGIYRIDIQGIIKSWNPGAENIYGWTSDEIVGCHVNKIYLHKQINEFAEIREKLLNNKTFEQFQCQRMHKDGSPRWVNNTYGAIHNPLGELIEIGVIAEDVSSPKKAKESVSFFEERFETFIEIAEDWIWELDKAGNFIFSSPAVAKILGYQIEEVIGKNILIFLSQENIETIQQQFEENIIQKEGWHHQVMHFIHKNGDERWIESNAMLILNPSHELVGYRGASRDITLVKSVEKIKNEFISMVSHELRTPLTSIHGAIALLLNSEPTPQERQALLNVAMKNSERLVSLINDVTDVQKLALGKLEYFFKKINLREVITEAINSSNIIAKRFNVKIVIESSLPDVEVSGDFNRLIQVIQNLLSNGIKFTPSQGIVEVAVQDLADTVKVSITDHGPGIPSEFEPKLFQKFAQADSSTTRGYGGTGLGLSISQSIIDAHHGKIQYNTEIGKGTTFFFELPKYNKDKEWHKN